MDKTAKNTTSTNTQALLDEIERLQQRVRDLESSPQKSHETGVASNPQAAGEAEWLKVTLSSIGDGVITTDTIGRVSMLNRVAEEMTGWTLKEASGRLLSEVFRLVHEQTREPCTDCVNKAIELGSIVQLAGPLVLISKNGSERLIADSAAPIRDAANNIIGVVLVFRDVTTELKMQADIQRSAKLESIGVLAGGIAHDFNNLLAAIAGNAGLAQMALYSNDTAQARLSLIEVENAAIRARDLTQQLLTFSRGGAPQKNTLSIEPILREAAGFALSGSRNRCRFDIQAPWPVHIDSGQITQVINNLLINADQAMPNPGEITIRAVNMNISPSDPIPVPPGPYVKVSVQDQGVGIPSESTNRVFDPFFTTKQKGTGLGLTSAYSIIKAHQGYITLEKTDDRGSTFSFYLPANPSAAKGVGNSHLARRLTHHLRILVMDDEDMIRDMLHETLISLGHEVTTVSDGRTAIVEYKNRLDKGERYDLAILDLTVPGGMGGKESIETLRQIDSSIRAVASSGYATDPVMADPTKYGFAGRLAKPYRISELQEILLAICGEEVVTTNLNSRPVMEHGKFDNP